MELCNLSLLRSLSCLAKTEFGMFAIHKMTGVVMGRENTAVRDECVRFLSRLIIVPVATAFLASWAGMASAESEAKAPTEIRVNCGGPVFTDSAGHVFEADREFKDGVMWGFVGGSVGAASDDAKVAGTDDPALFRTERWGVKEYRFNVEPGIYDVRMMFNEFHFTAPRRRVFDILLNGKKVVSDLDIIARVGQNHALEVVRTVSAADGVIVIGVNEKNDKAKFSALVVEPATANEEAPPTPSGIVSHPRADRVGLEWAVVDVPDLHGYRVYRGIEENELRLLTSEPLQEAYFVDKRIAKGKTHYYAVSAIDLFGNESLKSEVVEVSAVEASESGNPAIGINIGGKACEDAKGRMLLADRPYNPAAGVGAVFAGSDHDVTARGVVEPLRSFQQGDLVYRFDIPGGIYRVKLGFLDPWSKRSYDRVFDVYFNEFNVLADLDIVARYGLGLPVEESRVYRVPDAGGLEVRFQRKHGQPLCSFIYVEPASAETRAPASVEIKEVIARDEVAFLRWSRAMEDDVVGYVVFRAEDKPEDFIRLTDSLLGVTRYVDYSVKNDRKYFYRVVAVDASGNESVPSDHVVAEPKSPTDDELLEWVSRAAFEYFMRECDPRTYLVKDKNVAEPKSAASIGFGLSAMCIGAENGWITWSEAERRAYLMLRALNFRADNKIYGLFFHYLDGDGGRSLAGYEDLISTVDSALLMWGAIAAAEYFGGRVRGEAELMMGRMNWRVFADTNRKMIKMAYRPAANRFDGLWDYYTDEALLIILLGIAAPNPEYRLEPEYFYTFIRERKSYKDIKDVVFTWPGALFTYTFAHCWIDFGKLGPDNPEALGKPADLAVDWFDNTRKACLANREFCIFLSKRYKSFGENAWGLTACSGPNNRYLVCGAPPCGGAAEAGGGTLALYGAGMAVPFVPEEAIAALRHYYTFRGEDGRKLLWKDEFDGGYGLIDAFNLNENFFTDEIHGINHGPMLLLIDNYRHGLMWRLCLQNAWVQEALTKVGYSIPEE